MSGTETGDETADLLESARGHHREGRLAEADDLYRQVLDRRPGDAEANRLRGIVALQVSDAETATSFFRRAIECRPDFARAHEGLGNVLTGLGRIDEAITAYRHALNIEPGLAALRSNMLLALNYASDVDDETLFAEHLAFGASHGASASWQTRARPADREPDRRLRIGYVSPDFRLHAIASFIMPPFIHHDRQRFELHAYYTHHLSDAVTAGFKGVVDHWTDAAGMSDDALAGAIRDDAIDILVDLAGHSGFNRLPVFARRPAPIQVTWVGYSNTTGLGAMDYRLTDSFYDPEGNEEALFTETLVRLPTRLCFQPPADCPPVGPLPARIAGHVTFLSAANLAKLNDPLLALWSRILAAVPHSRMLVLNAGSPASRDRLLAAFERGGIASERLDLEGRRPFAEYLSLHNQVDIGLDAYPFNGAATSYTAAWMGVPHITLCGSRPCSRHGYHLFGNLGLGELVAGSAEDYVERAVGLAQDIERLAALRDDLRSRLTASPAMDGAAQTRALEDAYRRMWTDAVA